MKKVLARVPMRTKSGDESNNKAARHGTRQVGDERKLHEAMPLPLMGGRHVQVQRSSTTAHRSACSRETHSGRCIWVAPAGTEGTERKQKMKAQGQAKTKAAGEESHVMHEDTGAGLE